MKSERKSLWSNGVLSGALTLSILSAAQATSIDSWNLGNVTVDEGPYTAGDTYNSVVYTDTDKIVTNGAIIWKEGSVVAPGAQVLTDSPEGSGRNCIITTGTNRADPTSPPKTCGDAFQSAKRVKTDARVPGTSMDLVFDVSATDTTSRTYLVLQKYINSILERIDGFTIELGYGTGDNFVPSTAGDGLAFTSADGSPVPAESIPPGDSNLGSLMSGGLFGDADFNTSTNTDGYFYLPQDVVIGLDGNPCITNPSGTGRSYYDLVAGEDRIQTVGNVQGLHYCLFGSMLGQSQLPYGYFFDADGDAATDAMTVGNWNGSAWETYVLIDPITGLVQLDAVGNYLRPADPPVVVPDSVVAQWCNAKDTGDGVTPFYFVAVLDDMGLTNNNYHITVSEALGSDTFTLRITNTGEGNPLETPWLTTLPPEVLGEPCGATDEPAATYDVALKEMDAPDDTETDKTSEVTVKLINYGPELASGLVTLVGTDSDGATVAAFSAGFSDLEIEDEMEIKFDWTAPSEPTLVSWLATLLAEGDSNPDNNSLTDQTIVK